MRARLVWAMAMAVLLVGGPVAPAEQPAAQQQPAQAAPEGQDTVIHMEDEGLSFTLPGGDWHEDPMDPAANQLVRYRKAFVHSFTILRTRSHGTMLDENQRSLFRKSFKLAPDFEITVMTCKKLEHQDLPAHQCTYTATNDGPGFHGTARVIFTNRYGYFVLSESMGTADGSWHPAALDDFRLTDNPQPPSPFSQMVEATGGGVSYLALLGLLVVLVFVFRKDIAHYFRKRPKNDEANPPE